MKKRTIGYSNDLTDSFLKIRNSLSTPDIETTKNRFLIRKGILQGVTQEVLITKASSSDDSLELKT
jgi:hypothetical protein